MKYLVLVLSMFLLMGKQALAEHKDHEENQKLPEDKSGFTMVQKPIVCGPAEKILGAIEKFGEKPLAIWMDSEIDTPVVFYINKKTGTITVVQRTPPALDPPWDKALCVLNQGYQLELRPPESEKIGHNIGLTLTEDKLSSNKFKRAIDNYSPIWYK